MSNFSIEPYFDPIKQWRYYITNDVAMRMPYDINDPLFLQKVSVLQAEQVKHMVAGSYSQTAAFRDETNANFAANRQAMEKGMNMLGSRITQVGGMITNSLENGFAAMNYGFTDLSNKAEIANAYLSDLNKGIALSNQYSQQIVQSTGQLNAGVAQVNRSLGGINNNLIAINRTLSTGFSILSARLSAISAKLDSILEELKIPETQRERRYHIQEGMKYLAQATKDNDDLYFEDALDEFNKAINIESKDFFSHYYAGYIYMYSKEHLDIDKAIEHLRRFIHYAKAAFETASVKSLWDDGCFNLSMCYYLIGKLPEAIQTIAMQTGDLEKVLLQQAKYLSLGSDVEKRQSMQVVTQILDKNPYAVMLLMQDKDMLMNPYLLEHIDYLRNETYNKAKESLFKAKEFNEYLGISGNALEKQYNNLKSKNTYLSAVELCGYYDGMVSVMGMTKMVRVEGGSFWMGAQSKDPNGLNYDKEAYNFEGPVHRVTLSTYYISDVPVTEELWKKVMGSKTWAQKDDNPAEGVSMNLCRMFLSKLNSILGLCYRLPTEAEWEYAARGGNKSRGFRYAGSDTIDDVAWYKENCGKGYNQHNIKTKKPNELGLYDMSGNVSEWCQDVWGYYGKDSQINPTPPTEGGRYVVRGGNWGSDSRSCLVFARNSLNGYKPAWAGFRLVLSK